MRALKNIAVLLVVLLSTTLSTAQGPTWEEAYHAYQSANNSKNTDDLVKAKELIDVVAARESEANNAKVWLVKGWVYKDMYKLVDKGDPTSRYRPISMESLYRSWKLQADISQNARQAYEFLATTMFNDAARAINDMDEALALALFKDFKTAELKLDPKKDLREKEIEFKNALGTLYTKKMRLEKDLSWYDKAVEVYEEVILADPNNYGANYNLAILHYNRGVQNIFNINPEADLIRLEDVQVVSKEFFVRSLPYMLKAHEIKPRRKETLIGLEGIYYSLQEREKSEHYSSLLEEVLKEEKK